MRRDTPRPDPDLSALPALVVAASLAAFALFVGQLLLTPAVRGVLLGVGGAVLAAVAAVAGTRRAVAAVLDRTEQHRDEQPPANADPQPID